jgi:hypothetical protein
LRKKRHREFLVTVCAHALDADVELRGRLLRSEPGTPLPVGGGYNQWAGRLIRRHRLRYWATAVRILGPSTAVVLFWAEEFPAVRDEAVIFSTADLGRTDAAIAR